MTEALLGRTEEIGSTYPIWLDRIYFHRRNHRIYFP
jgi:hypothetical protein